VKVWLRETIVEGWNERVVNGEMVIGYRNEGRREEIVIAKRSGVMVDDWREKEKGMASQSAAVRGAARTRALAKRSSTR
jgi:hypothetical protein